MANPPEHNAETQKAQVQAQFARTAESYVTSITHKTGSDLERLVAVGEWDARQHALDVATGGGHTAFTIAPYVGQVMVTDLTPTMLQSAQTYLLAQGIKNAQFQIADAEALPFADASFDRVTNRIASHHFPNAAQSVQEAARVLKPEGIFILIDSTVPEDAELDPIVNKIEKWRDHSHGRSHTPTEWKTFFREAGLQVELEEPFRRIMHYDDWSARSQMTNEEKAALEEYILTLPTEIQNYLEVHTTEDGHLKDFSIDFTLFKTRKR
ncbi:class I SAM-dependent methyltransferase [Tengunoibacter tsumagoiensis]|uniref:Methyltransferase n=1 Tax=Tengunoibacter tsumagoiensis TaxID=2014871 RepID=A0A402A6T5_9CHLR|nr:class I SAM-dependent methyltransferase [Tengunoibacter tsumagoiensis]GCE14828.1 methyltransferase [Tengunoibacter tsumagoiensis]